MIDGFFCHSDKSIFKLTDVISPSTKKLGAEPERPTPKLPTITCCLLLSEAHALKIKDIFRVYYRTSPGVSSAPIISEPGGGIVSGKGEKQSAMTKYTVCEINSHFRCVLFFTFYYIIVANGPFQGDASHTIVSHTKWVRGLDHNLIPVYSYEVI